MKNKRGRPQKKKRKVTRREKVPVVYCKDLSRFTEEVIRLRRLPNHETLLLKFGVDEGQGFLKVTLSIIHLLGHTDREKTTFKSRLKDSGVKKIFIVSITPGKETYENLFTLLKSLNIPAYTFPFQIAVDLKVIAAMVGLSSSSSATFPCPICLWQKKDGADGEAPMRTFEQALDDYERWMQEMGGEA